MNPKELAALDIEQLTMWLTEQAREARSWVVSEEYDRLHDLLSVIRNAADFASGTTLSILEIAEAFVAPLGGRNFGRRELEVQRFLRSGRQAEELLNDLLLKAIAPSYEKALSAQLQTSLDELVRQGVLLRSPGGLTIAPGMIGPVREILAPPAFRLWATVDQARRECLNMDGARAAQLVASRVGVTVDEAKRYLAQFPVSRRRALSSGARATFIAASPSDQDVLGGAQEDEQWQLSGELSPANSALAQRN